MSLTVQQFREVYPEFDDDQRYASSQLSFWLTTSYSLLNADRWGAQLDLAAGLYTAHNVVLETRAQTEASNGGIPGQSQGAVASKSIDKVSVSYDTGGSAQEGAGHWNLTVYGTRLAKLIRIFGAGPVQVGSVVSPLNSGQAWPGPFAGYYN